jgi:hypothetical protein
MQIGLSLWLRRISPVEHLSGNLRSKPIVGLSGCCAEFEVTEVLSGHAVERGLHGCMQDVSTKLVPCCLYQFSVRF